MSSNLIRDHKMRGVADSFAKWTTWKISDISDLFSPKLQVFSVFSDFSGFFRFFRFFQIFQIFQIFQVFSVFFSFFSFFFSFFGFFSSYCFFLSNKGKRLEESYFLFILSWTKLEIYDLLFHQNTIFFSKSGFGRWRESARVQTYYLCLEGWSQLMALFKNIFLLQRLSIKLITAPMSS